MQLDETQSHITTKSYSMRFLHWFLSLIPNFHFFNGDVDRDILTTCLLSFPAKYIDRYFTDRFLQLGTVHKCENRVFLVGHRPLVHRVMAFPIPELPTVMAQHQNKVSIL